MARSSLTALRLLLLPIVFLAASLPRPALACSCAESTLQDMVNRHPDAAIAVVRRIDRDGGANGVGLVERRLRGVLPEQVPLALDDGGSCRPHLGVGQVATLSLQPSQGSWATIDCGLLDAATTFSAAFGVLRVDPDSRGDPAVALAGGMPGAGIVLLDRRLAVLAVADVKDAATVDPCGPGLLVTSYDDGGRTVVSLLALPELEPMRRPLVLGNARRFERIIDVRCSRAGRVRAIVRSEGDRVTTSLYTDLFEGRPLQLPPVADAAFAGNSVLLLRSDDEGTRSSLSAQDLATGKATPLQTFDGVAAYSVGVSPDASHAFVRGYADESLLMMLNLRTGAVVGRAGGSWMPPEDDGWLDDRRLLLVDENRELGAPPLGARVVNLRLAEVGRLPPMAAGRLVAGGGMVAAVGGAELAVAAAGRPPRVSDDIRTATAWDAALLGRLPAPAQRDAQGGQASTVAALPQPQPGIEPREGPGWLPVGGAGAVVGVGAALWLLARRRRQKTP